MTQIPVMEDVGDVGGLSFAQTATFLLPGLSADAGLRLKTHHRGVECLAISNKFGQVIFCTDTGNWLYHTADMAGSHVCGL